MSSEMFLVGIYGLIQTVAAVLLAFYSGWKIGAYRYRWQFEQRYWTEFHRRNDIRANLGRELKEANERARKAKAERDVMLGALRDARRALRAAPETPRR